MRLVQQARTLARALKDQERREGDKLGFSAKPGDCLAFKYYRDVRPHVVGHAARL